RDLGCTPTQPVCDEAAVGGHDCVECTKNSDCATGEACDLSTNTCVECLDDADYPAVDSGCIPVEPVCVEQGSISGGGGATIKTCVVCEDDQANDRVPDEGCTNLTP